MGNLQKISQLVLLPSQVQEQTKPVPAELTQKQISLKSGANKTDFINAWGSSSAINQVPTVLSDVVAMAEQSVTLADVRAVWKVDTAVEIVAKQLGGLFYFSEASSKDADVQRKVTQLMDSAALIVDEFYFLTMPELCSFFRRVKTGMYGQISWGSLGINVQQLFSVMREFQRDRKTAYDKLEAERQKNESLERRCKDYAGAVIGGIEGHYQKCDEDFYYFVSSFPFLQDLTTDRKRILWGRFKENREDALKTIWGIHENQKVKSADSSNDNLKNE